MRGLILAMSVSGVLLAPVTLASLFWTGENTSSGHSVAGGRVVFGISVGQRNELAVVNADGSGTVSVLPTPRSTADFSTPAWSSDGRTIAYYGGGEGSVWTINGDGTHPHRIAVWRNLTAAISAARASPGHPTVTVWPTPVRTDSTWSVPMEPAS
jgi:hypothetical protein